MLEFSKDVFMRLVLSAQKNKSLNEPFKTIHFDSWDNFSPKGIDDSTLINNAISEVTQAKPSDSSDFDRRVADKSNMKSSNTSRTKSFILPRPTEKIDEKVEKIISDPVIAEIKMELEVAEKLLKKIKTVDTHNQKIPIIEHTITRLKAMLEQKSYV